MFVFVECLSLWNKWPLNSCLCGVLSDIFQRYSTIKSFLILYCNWTRCG